MAFKAEKFLSILHSFATSIHFSTIEALCWADDKEDDDGGDGDEGDDGDEARDDDDVSIEEIT